MSDTATAPRSPSALRLAQELAGIRRAVRSQLYVLLVVVFLQAVIAVMIRLG